MNSSPHPRLRTRIILGAAALCLVIAGIAGAFWFYRTEPGATLSVSDATTTSVSYNTPDMHFVVATTTAQREQGLSGRKSVPADFGMLFVFPQPKRYGFWMKDMLVPIDIIWLSDNGTIVGIENNLSPNTYPQVFYPQQPVRYVLEIKAGGAAQRGWHIGTKVPLPLPYGEAVSH